MCGESLEAFKRRQRSDAPREHGRTQPQPGTAPRRDCVGSMHLRHAQEPSSIASTTFLSRQAFDGITPRRTCRRARGCPGRWPASRPAGRAGPAAAGQFAQVWAAALRRCGHGRALVLPRWSTGVLGWLPEGGVAWSVGAVGTEDGGVCQESVRFSSGRPTPKLTISVQTGCKSCLRDVPSFRSSSHGRGGACAGRRARDGLLEEESELLL